MILRPDCFAILIYAQKKLETNEHKTASAHREQIRKRKKIVLNGLRALNAQKSNEINELSFKA